MTINPFRQRPPGQTINPFTGQPTEREHVATPNPPSVGEGHPASGTPVASAAETPAPPSDTDPAEIKAWVAEARELKSRMDADKDRYAEIRSKLWDAAGHRAGKLPGTTAKFRAPNLSPRRRVDYTALEHFPEAYQAAVTETEPDPETPGALYL